MPKIQVAFLSSEIGPFAKVGGLGDVAGSLPKYLFELGADVTVFSGKYQQTDLKKLKVKKTSELIVKFGGRAYPTKTHEVWLPKSKVSAVLFEEEHWLSRGEIYEAPPGITDPHYLTKRFLFLSRAVIDYLKKTKSRVNVLHVNDWTSAAAVLMAQKDRPAFSKTKTLFTVHNITHGGFVDERLLRLVDLSTQNFSRLSQSAGNLRYFDIFAESLLCADAINTVSPTYAKELLKPEFARGLEKIFQARKSHFIGILNGIDTEYFDPLSDPYIAAGYDAKKLDRKRLNKTALQKTLGLKRDGDLPIYSVITRLAEQKGVSLIVEAVHLKKRKAELTSCTLMIGRARLQYLWRKKTGRLFPRQKLCSPST
ncbi:MAG: glycogen/starch synthase, partial [Patescibacteria group bacterium]|nr:glycogen/starch synthase [Patescibacteria group bacterium]